LIWIKFIQRVKVQRFMFAVASDLNWQVQAGKSGRIRPVAVQKVL
jgi:hypothetical protein